MRILYVIMIMLVVSGCASNKIVISHPTPDQTVITGLNGRSLETTFDDKDNNIKSSVKIGAFFETPDINVSAVSLDSIK